MICILSTATLSSFASLKCRMVLPFWCRLTQVVPKKAVKRVVVVAAAAAATAANVCICSVCMLLSPVVSGCLITAAVFVFLSELLSYLGACMNVEIWVFRASIREAVTGGAMSACETAEHGASSQR